MSREETPARVVKAAGIASLKTVAKVSNVPVSTLGSWFIKRRFVFDAIYEKVARDAI